MFDKGNSVLVNQYVPIFDEVGLEFTEERKRRRGDSEVVGQWVFFELIKQAQVNTMDIDGVSKTQNVGLNVVSIMTVLNPGSNNTFMESDPKNSKQAGIVVQSCRNI